MPPLSSKNRSSTTRFCVGTVPRLGYVSGWLGCAPGCPAAGAVLWAYGLRFALDALPSAPHGAVAGAVVGGALAVAAGTAGLLSAPGRRAYVP